MYSRQLENMLLNEDYGRQMLFIAGPRQVGKTTLVKDFLKKKQCSDLYFNWDIKKIRADYRQDPNFYFKNISDKKRKEAWICFDEIHKIKGWKNILKSHFDEYESKIKTIVTGSARLDMFRKSGDSLAGRYFLFRLLPMTLAEMNRQNRAPEMPETGEELIENFLSKNTSKKQIQENYKNLLLFSGFPEPLKNNNKKFHQIWQREYIERIVYEDLSDLTQINDLDKIAELIEILPSKVCNPLSVNSLKEDLEINHATVKNYLRALKLGYVLFFLEPYSKNITRSIKKEKKTYFYDWSRVENEAYRFENYVACELLNLISLWNDTGEADLKLQYVRDRDAKETDFLIVRNKKPWLLLEAKYSKTNIESHHYKTSKELGGVPIIQICSENDILEKKDGAIQISASRFFA